MQKGVEPVTRSAPTVKTSSKEAERVKPGRSSEKRTDATPDPSVRSSSSSALGFWVGGLGFSV